jgi:hypothetical protein
MAIKPAKRKGAPISKEVRDAIRSAAQDVGLYAVGLSTGDGKAYEAWALLAIAACFQDAKKAVVPRDSSGNTTLYFRVAGGPSYIPLTIEKPLENACHFFVDRKWELHSSLRHEGSSGDSHEFDVSLVCSDAADAIRHSKTAGPYVGWAPVGIELKEYSRTSTLPKGFARALLGVAFDISPGQFLEPIKITIQRQTTHVWSPFWPPRTRFLLATTTTLTGPTKQLLDHYRIGHSENADVSAGLSSVSEIVIPHLGDVRCPGGSCNFDTMAQDSGRHCQT